MSAEHNGRLSFLLFSRLSLRGGRLATKIITIILSAFSFMLFALGSTGYLYNEVDYITRGYLNFCESQPYIQVERFGNFVGTDKRTMSLEEVETFEQTSGKRFVYSISGFDWHEYLAISDYKERARAPLTFWYNNDRNSMAGSEEDYTSVLGYSLLAGRYPTAENEVAVSEVHYKIFHEYGYCNASKNYIWTNIDSQTGKEESYYWYYYDEELPREEKQNINSYEDMLGKTFGYGDPETEEQAVCYKIVGVVNTDYDYDSDKNNRGINYLAGSLFFCEDHKRSAKAQEYGVSAIYCSNDMTYAIVKDWLELTLQYKEEAQGGNYPCPYYLTYLCRTDDLADEAFIALVAGCAGTFFGFFAVLLNGHLTTISLEQKQKKIGILRAMGASQRKVTRIFLFEAFVTATCIFLLALLASLGIFYGWLEPLSTVEAFGVSLLQYNGWTVLILAVICYAVPLLCTIAPLKRFFKKPITDNITGNTMKKIKKGSRSM